MKPDLDIEKDDSSNLSSIGRDKGRDLEKRGNIGITKDDSEGPTTVSPLDPSQFPDGGLTAWLTVAGAFFCIFCSFGWINCIGIFQEYYQSHSLSSYSPSTISWIASLELFIMYAGGVVVGRIYDKFGPRYLLIFGTVIHVFGLMMASLSTQYYQIMLAQGVCSPLGITCLFNPSFSCVATWFMKKRGLAFGIVAAGSSLGGVIFPIMFNHLIPRVGFPWSMRICAFMILALLLFANVVTRSRLPPMPREVALKDYFRPLTEMPFLTTTIAAFLFYLGLFLPIDYVETQAIELGMSHKLANYLIPILNASSIFGRILPGYLGDRAGRYNTITVLGFISSVISLALWLPARGNAPIIVFSALYGFFSGAMVSLLPALIASISDIKEIGTRTGSVFAILSISALVSNPIGGAFISLDNGNYTDLQIWCGVILFVSSAAFAVARSTVGGWKLTARV